ncbi:hypothetical protein [Paenibacillus aestuarii]|uniref:DNA alkylation repair protein n=1 Tax=Paenibacillus aestuarii TaxID=516965 RepID=A0ABW0K526_9BACL|nr:hypothetical protein [Paenibacillus aestuarii]
MEEKPYFCPNCRSNRVKFNVITSYAQSFMKDALTGNIVEFKDPNPIPEPEATIQCLVCSFTGNEMRFIKQAEREPRVNTSTTTFT